MTLDRAN